MHRVLHTAATVVLLLLVLAGCSEEEQAFSKTEQQRQEASRKVGAFLVEAQQALHQGAYGAALVLADSAERYAPELADVPFLRGRIFTELRRYAEAEEAYRRVLELDPGYRGTWFNLGNNAFRQGQFREALERYRQEQERYPTPSLLLQIGRAHAQLGEVERAREAYEQVLAADATPTATEQAAAYVRLSQLRGEEGAFEVALRYAHRALELAPDDLDYQYLTGYFSFRAGQLEEAVELLKGVAEQRPWHYEAHYNLGQALLRLARREEAQQYLARAGSIEVLQSEIEQARARAESNPKALGAWVALGDVLRRAGRHEEAADAYKAALYLAPRDLVLQNNVANLALVRGDTTEAVARYRTILQQDSTFVSGWLNLGVTYALSGRVEQARHAWQQALRYAPGHPAAKAYLARLEDS